MNNTLLFVGIGAIVILIGGWFAFNHSFTSSLQNQKDITNSPQAMTDTLTLTSSAFRANGSIPSKFTCDAGASALNPPLSISGVPAGTKTLALLVDDPDIPQVFKQQRGIDAFDHWTLFNIPASTTEIAQGMTVGTPGANGGGKNEYAAPCPPKEYEPSEHRYFFKLYALDAELPLKAGATKKEILHTMEGHILAETELIGKYKRQ